ncbi:hypothetical protein HOI83_04615 [Candidatus Uhrbacteria bacterium]|jgi:hypothetical protein|nr:hypothetical protein [Candidatus Uhrbacteria bacterium]
MRIRSIILALLIALPLITPGAVFAAASTQPEVIAPQLQVNIPGLGEDDFKGSVIVGTNQTREQCTPGKVCVGTISVYLNAVFKFMVTAGIIFSIVIIMIGGIEYMVGSASGSIEKAKKHITGAVTGLALLLAATSIVTFINPDISGLRSLELTILKNVPYAPKTDVKETAFGTAVKTDLLGADGEMFKGGLPVKDAEGNIVDDIMLGNGSDNIWMHEKAIIRLQAAAGQLNSQNTGDVKPHKLELLQTYISPQKAAIKFIEKCVYDNCSQDPYCNPFPDGQVVEGSYTDGFTLTSAIKEESKDMKNEEFYALVGQQALLNDTPRCPFQTGFAVAAVCYGDSVNKADAECQKKLEKVMKTNNFCRSVMHPWLYEFEGKQVLDSTKGCEAPPGIMLMPEANETFWNKCNSSHTFSYTGDGTVLCAREYGDACSDAGVRTKDNVDLTTGRCD